MKTIKINEEMRLPGTDVILEEGDRISIQEVSAPKMKVNTDAKRKIDSIIDQLNAYAIRYKNHIDGKVYASAASSALRALQKVNWERAPELR